MVISLLVGVVGCAVLGIHLYLEHLRTSAQPLAEPALAAAAPFPTPPAPSSAGAPSQLGPTAAQTATSVAALFSRDPSAISPVAGTEGETPPLPDEAAGKTDETQTVVASKITAEPLASKPRPTVVDPWPQLEATLGGNAPNVAFEAYVASEPPRNPDRRPLALCVIGSLSPAEERLLLAAREFLGVTFDTPVRIQRRIAIEALAPQAVRHDPRFNDSQLDTQQLLGNVLPAERTDAVFAVLGVTTGELFPAPTPEFLRWQNVSRERASLFLVPQQSEVSPAADVVRRRLHQTLAHAIQGAAPLFGLAADANERSVLRETPESEGPLLFSPAALHQLCWNLDREPSDLLAGQLRYFEKVGLRSQAAACRDAIRRIKAQTTSASQADDE